MLNRLRFHATSDVNTFCRIAQHHDVPATAPLSERTTSLHVCDLVSSRRKGPLTSRLSATRVWLTASNIYKAASAAATTPQ